MKNKFIIQTNYYKILRVFHFCYFLFKNIKINQMLLHFYFKRLANGVCENQIQRLYQGHRNPSEGSFNIIMTERGLQAIQRRLNQNRIWDKVNPIDLSSLADHFIIRNNLIFQFSRIGYLTYYYPYENGFTNKKYQFYRLYCS
ncbi:hypothetical protein pb186bvf_013089 [Paramecium bursaria]